VSETGIPWTYLLTETLTTLGQSEEWFWAEELRIVWNLIEEKKKIDDIKMKNSAIYIASYVWGKDPDEGKESDRPMPGRDCPATDEDMRGFYG